MDLEEWVRVGDPLLREALSAVRRYHEAKDSSAPAEEVNQLWLQADSLMEVVLEYQRRYLGAPSHSYH